MFPLFFKVTQLEKEALREWIESTLEKFGAPDIFLVDLDWNSSTKKLVVYIESDSELLLSRCQKISRFIEKNLDDSEIIGLHYSIAVSSPGVDRPLTSLRQYPKNVGRVLRLILQDDTKIIGRLVKFTDRQLTVQLEQKKGKHKRMTYGDPLDILFENIKETFVEIRF